jgi:hypothetical protein
LFLAVFIWIIENYVRFEMMKKQILATWKDF